MRLYLIDSFTTSSNFLDVNYPIFVWDYCCSGRRVKPLRAAKMHLPGTLVSINSSPKERKQCKKD